MLKFFKNSAVASFITLIVILAISGGFYYIGYKQGIEHPKITIVKGLANLKEGKEESVDFKLFWDAWNILKEKYVDGRYKELDGLSVEYNDPADSGASWWFNLRPSNTEPVMRLVVEAKSKELLDRIVGELMEIIKTAH